MRRTGSWKWPAQPAVLAASVVLAAAGGAIGWRIGGAGATVVGVVAGLAAAVLLALAVDRLGSALTSPRDRRRAERPGRH